MPRWQPNAPDRLVLAALDLFAERGYEQTTVVDIAERAGVTKSTFFRHFRDKREVLFGRDALSDVLVEAIETAPEGASPLDAVGRALDALAEQVFRADRRELTARRRAAIAANPELQEREALKALALTTAMTDALKRRGTPDLQARVAAQLGALASTLAYERWTQPGARASYGELARAALRRLQDAAAALDA